MSERYKQDLSKSLTLRGKDVSKLPATLLMSYCEKVSYKLNGPHTIPESPKELYQAILEERAVVAIDSVTMSIYGFAQVKPVPEIPNKWIFNSWTSFASGIGAPIVWSAAALVHDIDPKAQVIAKARERNTKAQKAISETGGVLIGHETSEEHFDPNSLQPIQKHIYDISLETLMPKRSQINSSLDLVRECLAKVEVASNPPTHPFLGKLRWVISGVLGFKDRLQKLH